MGCRAAVLTALVLSLISATRTVAAAQSNGAAELEPPTPPAEPDAGASRLRVGVAGNEPFVTVGEDDALEGISIDVWAELAERLDLEYELVRFDNVEAVIDSLAEDGVDVAIGPMSITSRRAARVAFTQPYYEGDLAIVAHPDAEGWWDRLAPFVSSRFLVGAGVLLLVLFFVGVLLWLAERGANEKQFPKNPIQGIANGVWFALVTMTTVGYGDRVPVTTAGRFVAGIWMLLALLTASSLTAFIATALTLSQLAHSTINSADDLDAHRVAVLEGTTAVEFARSHGARVVQADSLAAAVQLVVNGDVDALVFDRPSLRYHLNQHPEYDLRMSEASYAPQRYGFALHAASPLRARLDVGLLRMAEDRTISGIRSRWLGD